MNFIVTGGAGFIGSHLTKYLVREQHSVTVIDNLCNGKKEKLGSLLKEIEFVNTDILNVEKLRDVFKNADGVFHQAALTDVQESFVRKKEYFDVNVNGTENILKIAKEFDLKVVFASSASVYGDTKEIPTKEDSERKPINPYGETKLEAEHHCEKYAKLGVSIIGLRYFNVYGKGQNDTYAGVITRFLESIKNGKPPTIFGDGLQVRDFIFVEDVIEANLLAMTNKVHHAFINIGSGIALSIKELADIIIEIAGLKINPVYDSDIKGDIRTSQADIELARKLLKWEPQTKLKDWLKEVIPKNLT